MTEEKRSELMRLARSRVFLAQSHIDKEKINENLKKHFPAESEIPGFEDRSIKFGSFINRQFVVLMTDIRGSKKIVDKPTGVTEMFQIFYSYSAVIANLVDSFGGTATEFLGDGVLCLFQTSDGVDKALTSAFKCSLELLSARNLVLNPIYSEYSLPQINYGIGVDHGITIVTKFGYKGDNDLKAFGAPVYNVSRLSKGINEVKFSPKSYEDLPKSPTGTIFLDQSSDADGKLAYKIRNPF
jgi:class 3 adenylate cyclase